MGPRDSGQSTARLIVARVAAQQLASHLRRLPRHLGTLDYARREIAIVLGRRAPRSVHHSRATPVCSLARRLLQFRSAK